MIPKIVSYNRPPIVESVLGIEFTGPIENWGLVHFGILWQSIRARYPKHSIQPPLMEQPGLTRFTGPELPRCWYVSETDDRLIQVQTDRFIVNWRRPQSEYKYPLYQRNREIFQEEWAVFCKMLDDEGLTMPQVKSCEVTYVNQIDENEGWQTYKDLGGVFANWSDIDDDWLPAPELVTFTSVFNLDGDRVLTCQVSPTERTDTKKKSIQLKLTAKSKPKESDTNGILAALDYCREAVDLGFEKFTTEQIQEFWGKEKP